ncbi:hypothetical protein SEPCBS119000_001685 [Sporothrix epigloea]|uniref:DUF202 domain-containing protein n=1 Tax=Sporothrix epigloea TaxID=1892477 RepID=A0ABP0DCB0_9PEZI
MFEALYPYPEDRLQMRMHRARSLILTEEELIELRAAQRTFEGAYMRTALSQFSFALVVLKIFTAEFYAIGALFAVYGVAVMLVAIYRRYEGNRQFFSAEEQVQIEDGEREEQRGSCDQLHLTQPSRVSTAHTRSAIKKKFRTSGNSVIMLSTLSTCAYISLIVLLWRLQD